MDNITASYYSDDIHDPQYWDHNGLEGLGDTTPATGDVSWIQTAANAIGSIASSVIKAENPQPAAPASTAIPTSTLLTYGAIGVGVILLFTMLSKKRR